MRQFGISAALVGFCVPMINAQWQHQPFSTNADFRGLCVAIPMIVWVSGTKGTFGRTTDGGKTWSVGTVAGAEKLDFRDVEAFGDSTANS